MRVTIKYDSIVFLNFIGSIRKKFKFGIYCLWKLFSKLNLKKKTKKAKMENLLVSNSDQLNKGLQ